MLLSDYYWKRQKDDKIKTSLRLACIAWKGRESTRHLPLIHMMIKWNSALFWINSLSTAAQEKMSPFSAINSSCIDSLKARVFKNHYLITKLKELSTECGYENFQTPSLKICLWYKWQFLSGEIFESIWSHPFGNH